MCRKLILSGFFWAALWASILPLCAQTLTVQGVADRANYRDSATFRIVADPGFTYLATLNGVPVPAGVSNTVSVMDYYDLVVRRTQTSSGTVTNALIRFIIESSRRLKASDSTSPELGLLEWIPLPPIPSTAAEISGDGSSAQLRPLIPQTYPAGLEIPVVVRVVNSGSGGTGDLGTRRVNWAWIPSGRRDQPNCQLGCQVGQYIHQPGRERGSDHNVDAGFRRAAPQHHLAGEFPNPRHW
jgi:hypothetical protein